MYKPGSMSAVPAVLGPHEPRLDWMLWEAARDHRDQSPWFTGLIQRLLEGKQEGELVLTLQHAPAVRACVCVCACVCRYMFNAIHFICNSFSQSRFT